jgi:hypothetical protein
MHDHRIITELADADITASTEQPPDPTRIVVMIYHKEPGASFDSHTWLPAVLEVSADGAASFLSFVHRVVLFRRYPVSGLESVLPGQFRILRDASTFPAS